MKKLIPLLLGGALIVGAVGCQPASRTSADAPNNTNETTNAPTKDTAQTTQNDATSDTRKRQIEGDIRSREERNNITGGDTNRADADLESEVRGKLEVNLPASQLTVQSKDGAVTVAGTVPTQEQISKIATLAQEIKGVKSVQVNAKVAPAKPATNNSGR